MSVLAGIVLCRVLCSMQLAAFFRPASAAVIGVSHDRRKVGYLVARNMIDQGYAGRLYLVNPKGGRILGRDVLPSIEALPDGVEMAILAIPADAALASLEMLHKKNIKQIVLFAAGFAEIGTDGARRNDELMEKCRRYGMTLLGPNCLGFVNTAVGLNATFLKHVVPSGNIGFISQSGALGSVMVDEFVSRNNLGISAFISLGNKALIDESDALSYLAHDDGTAVIAMYLEDVRNGEKFKHVLKEATRQKPVVILKSGTSPEGSKAALSHTGGLAGDDHIYSSLFRQYGAIRAKTYSEFIVLITIFAYGRVLAGRDILVLSNAGGCGVLLADDLVANNLGLVTLTEETKTELANVFGMSRHITVHNPIDILGDASAYDYEKAISHTLAQRDIGAVIVLLTPQANTEIMETAKVIAQAQERTDRPIFPVFMGRDSVAAAHDFFARRRIAGFRSFDVLVPALSKAAEYQEYIARSSSSRELLRDPVFAYTDRAAIQKILSRSKSRKILTLEDSLRIMQLAGVPIVPVTLVQSAESLSGVVKELSYPITMKIASDVVTHKTEVRGVHTNIASLRHAQAAYEAIRAIPEANGVYVQKQISGCELFLGGKRDPNFGVVLVVGLGGVYAELLKETASRIFPFSHAEFIRMVQETKLYRLLSGFRGKAPADMGALYHTVYNAGLLMQRFPEIQEFDLNPLFVSDSGVAAVDARVILSPC